MEGKYRVSTDPVLLSVLRENGMVIVSFDRRTLAMHAGALTREGLGHAGVILFRRIVSQIDYGKQSRLLAEFWREAAEWDWMDRIEYLAKGGPGRNDTASKGHQLSVGKAAVRAGRSAELRFGALGIRDRFTPK
ncbi:MAG: hypothetical protein C5B50_12805 [Verrucomicrobia bacterium]|nr:MAG: hypothetical protein C5B50_12805 [Verrucomicrobiota bacterium]